VIPDPELATFLCEAAQVEGVAVAIISGRALDDLAHRVGAIPAFLAGSHGLEIRDPSGHVLREAPPVRVDLDGNLELAVQAAGARIERKRHGIALHWRGVPGFDGTHPIVGRFRDWAEASGLELIDGRRVVEAGPPGGGKARALEFIADHVAAERVVYAGDDFTDFPALAFASTRGRALFIRSNERDPAPGAEELGSRAELLQAFAMELREAAVVEDQV
jgi:trehalose-phosphatase